METYELIFECNSNITKIPDSQTIFGYICNVIKFYKGEDELEKYLESFSNNKPYLIHSSMFFNDCLPMIKKPIYKFEDMKNVMDEEEGENKLKMLNKFKKIKKIKYLKNSQFKEYLNYINEKESTDFNVNKVNFDSIPSPSIESGLLIKNKLLNDTEKENELFYNKIYYCDKKNKQYFSIYVKTNNLDEENLKLLFEKMEYLGIGARRSVGFNSFKLIDIKNEKNIEIMKNCIREPYNIILSKYIPEIKNNKLEFDNEESFYQIESNMYINDNNFERNNIVGRYTHFVEGSCMKFRENKEYYGKLIKNDNGSYHYGIGFVL